MIAVILAAVFAVFVLTAVASPMLADWLEERRELRRDRRDGVVARTAPYRRSTSPRWASGAPAAELPPLDALDERRALVSALVAKHRA